MVAHSGHYFIASFKMESRAPEPVGAYPYTRRVGNLLFLSGVGPRQRGQKAIPGVVQDAAGATFFNTILKASAAPCFRTCATSWKKPGPSGTTWWT